MVGKCCDVSEHNTSPLYSLKDLPQVNSWVRWVETLKALVVVETSKLNLSPTIGLKFDTKTHLVKREIKLRFLRFRS